MYWTIVNYKIIWLIGPWTCLNLNHLNSTRLTTIRFTTNIRECNLVVKRDPPVYCSPLAITRVLGEMTVLSHINDDGHVFTVFGFLVLFLANSRIPSDDLTAREHFHTLSLFRVQQHSNRPSKQRKYWLLLAQFTACTCFDTCRSSAVFLHTHTHTQSQGMP
jgi:hypothetical protein